MEILNKTLTGSDGLAFQPLRAHNKERGGVIILIANCGNRAIQTSASSPDALNPFQPKSDQFQISPAASP